MQDCQREGDKIALSVTKTVQRLVLSLVQLTWRLQSQQAQCPHFLSSPALTFSALLTGTILIPSYIRSIHDIWN